MEASLNTRVPGREKRRPRAAGSDFPTGWMADLTVRRSGGEVTGGRSRGERVRVTVAEERGGKRKGVTGFREKRWGRVVARWTATDIVCMRLVMVTAAGQRADGRKGRERSATSTATRRSMIRGEGIAEREESRM